MTNLSKEQLEDMLRTTIREIESFYKDEYSSNEECRPLGMTMQQYDQLFGLDRIQRKIEEIEYDERQIERWTERENMRMVKKWKESKKKHEEDLRMLEQNYEM